MNFDSPLLAEVSRPGHWLVMRDLVWENERNHITVPAGFETDLASIPWYLRWLLNQNGRSREPAVLHDYLYRTRMRTRAEADRIFREALEAEGMGDLGRSIYWSGVRLGGWWPYNRVGERLKRLVGV